MGRTYRKDPYGRWRQVGAVDLFADPTLGSRSALEQAAGVNQAFDPGMSFGTAAQAPRVTAVDPGSLPGVSFDPGNVGMTSADVIAVAAGDSAVPAPSNPVDWKKIALWGGLGVLLLYWLSSRK